MNLITDYIKNKKYKNISNIKNLQGNTVDEKTFDLI